MRTKKQIFYRYLTASIEIIGSDKSPAVQANFWIESLHLFGASVPIKRGEIGHCDLLLAEIYPACGAPVSTAWDTASLSDAHLAFIIGNEIRSQLGPTWAVKVTNINRNPVSRLEFEEYTQWINSL